MDKLASVCGVLAVFAAIAATDPAAAQGSVLRARLNADIRSTEPGVNRDANSDAVVVHLVEGLVALKEDTTVGPLLAQKVEVAKDGKTYSFRLRDGLRFHNGAPLVADDVVWSWNRYLAPATQWRCLPEFDGRGITKVLAVEAPDPKTVVFRLERPSALFLATMARSDCGADVASPRDPVHATSAAACRFLRRPARQARPRTALRRPRPSRRSRRSMAARPAPPALSSVEGRRPPGRSRAR